MVDRESGQWNVATKENAVYLERVSKDDERKFDDLLEPHEARQLAELLTKYADKLDESPKSGEAKDSDKSDDDEDSDESDDEDEDDESDEDSARDSDDEDSDEDEDDAEKSDDSNDGKDSDKKSD